MVFILSLLLTGMIGYGLYLYATSAKERASVNRDVRDKPLLFVWHCVGLIWFLLFFWGVVVSAFGSIRVPLWEHQTLALWQVGGIGCLVWFIIALIFPKL